MKNQIPVALLGLALLAVSGCSKGTDGVPATCERASKAAEEVQAAATKYTQTMARADCEAYKAKLTEFVNAADKCTNYAQADINQARQSINSITCQ